MPWIFNEDGALKAKLSGLSVTDTNAPAGRPVAVRFRLPETELANLTFPVLIIEHASISEDTERAHRGFIPIPYAPEGLPLWDDPNLASGSLDPSLSPYEAEFPIPFNLDYQVTLLSRKSQHHIYLVGMLAQQDRIPARFGGLDIPQDGTVRRLDLIGGPEMGNVKDVDGKRLFTAAYRIRVSSELFPTQISTYDRVLSLVGTIQDTETAEEMETWWNTYNDQPPEALDVITP